MRRSKKYISVFTVFCIMFSVIFSNLQISAIAENAGNNSVVEGNSIADNIYTSDIDNSEIEVKVMKQSGDNQTEVFSGKLKDYDNGKYVGRDFEGIQFLVIFNWDDELEDEAIYIIPKSNQINISANENVSVPDTDEINEIVQTASTQNLQSDIKCDVNLMYDGAYSESIIKHGKQLKIPVKITNTSGKKENIVCYIAEYGDNNVLINCKSSAVIPVEANGQAVSAEMTKTFSDKTKSVKIFIWKDEIMQPITGVIKLDENENDYYSDTAANAQEYDMQYQIKGKINTSSDVDYIKFIPKTTGEYSFDCVSTVGINADLYNGSQSTLKTGSSSYKYSLTTNQIYYLKMSGSIGDYYVSVRYNASSEADSFDVYKFDVDTNIYKKSILDTCSSLYYSNASLAEQMYDEYETILGADAKLHKLPEFLSDHPKELSNFDNLLNQYYGTKYDDFLAMRQRYIDLIDKYSDLVNEVSVLNVNTDVDIADDGEDSEPENEETNDELYPIIGKYTPSAKRRENIEIGGIGKGDEIQATAVTPSFTIVSTTATSITYKATFPVSNQWGNIIKLIDFNTNDGLTLEKNQYGDDEYRQSGQYTISNLTPGGIYVLAMWWSTDGAWTGGDNSIYRFVQLPNNTSENLTLYTGGRVTARLEAADKALASSSDFNTWLSNMDKAYNAYKELTGYTPYNSKKIEMCSTRDNLNDIMGISDGQNYWWVVFGYYTGGSTKFQHAKAFYQGHMRRLSKGDWGDTPMHELSHVFDNYKWNFDAETLAQFKLYYVVSTLNAKVYRSDRYDNNSNGWYTGNNYYTLLKSDRYLDSYDASFGNGTYASEGFATILIDIQKKIGWNPFKKTFRYFSGLSYRELPDTDGETLKLFLTKLKDYSGHDVLGDISKRDTRIIESHFGINLEYVEPVYPSISGGSSGGGSHSEVNADKGNYAIYQFSPTTSGNYYIYTSPYAGSGVSNDTYIEVYTNANLSGTPIASNDDYDGGRFSKVSIAATEGTTYYIKVRHYANGQLHAELNITKDAPVQALTLNGYEDIITSSGEFALFSFTPDATGAYVFEVSNHNGGTTEYNTYIKLYDNISMTNRVGNAEKRIAANLTAGHTYYLQFSGFLMKYAKGRISVSPGQTLQFTKRSDSSFIYVNSPEYITRIDIVDDSCHTENLTSNIGVQPYMKIFEQEDVTGKNTYYQTHTAWWGAQPGTYEPISDFYIDVDFYNPTGNTITVSINNLAYGTEYSILENYYNGNGVNVDITIPPYSHKLLFETLNAPLIMTHPGSTIDGNGWDWSRHRSPIILFDFQVNTGNIVISSMAAYDNSNLYLRNGSKNIIDNSSRITENGEVVSDLSQRPNETDLYGKMKGIAQNESAWIDSNIDIVIDDNTSLGSPIPINLKDDYYTYGISNPKWSWKSSINPLNDAWDSVIMMLPSGLHNFKYHFNESNREWYFDFAHRDLRFCDINGSRVSVNDPVPSDIVDNAKLDMASGKKEHFGSEQAPDEYSMSIGEWGATYHYSVTVKNTTDSDRTVNVKMWSAENMIFGLKKQGEENYSTTYYATIYNTPDNPTKTATVNVPANGTTSFEFVTLLGGGHGGLNHAIVIE